jgi:hypothetical protein
MRVLSDTLSHPSPSRPRVPMRQRVKPSSSIAVVNRMAERVFQSRPPPSMDAKVPSGEGTTDNCRTSECACAQARKRSR